MGKLLSKKKVAVTISIIAAFVFWLVIVIDQNPEREQTFNNIPIEINTEGTIWEEQGLCVVSDVAQKASVTVYGPNYIVSSLKSNDIKINADLSSVDGSGTYVVNLTAIRNSSKNGYSFLSISPSTVTVKFDYYRTHTVSVEPVIEGYKKLDAEEYQYDEVFANTNSKQYEMAISGPLNDLNRIDKVIAYANTDKVISTTTTFNNGEIKLLDSDGNELDKSKYDIPTETLPISVMVSKTKEIYVVPTYSNLPNDNVKVYLNKIVTSDVQTLKLKGVPEVIDSLTSVEFNPIDVTKISPKNETNVFTVTPVLPNGVAILDGVDSVTFSFDTSQLAVKTIAVKRFVNEGALSAGLSATYPATVYVNVCGQKTMLESLSRDDCYLAVDLSSFNSDDRGNNTVDATVKNNGKIAIWQVVPCQIDVKIK